jgi:hypothetical protein
MKNDVCNGYILNDIKFIALTYTVDCCMCFICLAATYEIGTQVPNTPCTFTVHASNKKQGVIVSPTYPGAYPKDLSCSYQFMGLTGQRIRIEFRDFDLFFGGPQYVIC